MEYLVWSIQTRTNYMSSAAVGVFTNSISPLLCLSKSPVKFNACALKRLSRFALILVTKL